MPPWLERHHRLFLILLTLLVWSPALQNGFAWDDRSLIVENQALVAPNAVEQALVSDFWSNSEAPSGYWRPLITLTYIAERALWGVEPLAYHVTNLVAHLLVVLLLAAWVRPLGRDALWGVALFAIHPALAETVAWVSGRTDSIALLWGLAYLLLDQRGKRSAWVFLILSLLSKEIGVLLPLIAAGRAALDTSGPWRDALQKRAIDFGIVGLYLVVRTSLIGAPGPLAGGLDIGLNERLFAVLHILGLVFWPFGGRVEYGAGLTIADLMGAGVAGAVGLIALGMAKDRRARALLLLSLLLYLPNIYAMVARGVVGERLVYVSAAFLLPAVTLVVPSLPAFGLAAALCAALSFQKASWYKSDFDLFGQALAAPHPSLRTHLNYGIALHDKGYLKESFEQLQKAGAAGNIDQGHYMFGLIFSELGCTSNAEAAYRRALEMTPGYVAAASNLAGLLLENGRKEEAIAVLQEANARRPDPLLQQNLAGLAELPAGQPMPEPDACATEQGFRSMLQDPGVLNRRALTMMRVGRLDAARILLDAALREQPDSPDVRCTYAQWLWITGQQAEAQAALRAVLATHPTHSTANKLKVVMGVQ